MSRFTTWPSRFALLLVLVLGATLIQVSAAPGTEAGTAAECLDATEQAFLSKINAYRASKGLGKLTATRTLNVASYKHSYDMGARRFFSHTNPDGKSPWTRMSEAGYKYNTYKGENIAAGYSSADTVFNGWKNSYGHNKNMLNPNFKAIGIGFASVSGSPYRYYWTTDFGGVVDAAPVC